VVKIQKPYILKEGEVYADEYVEEEPP